MIDRESSWTDDSSEREAVRRAKRTTRLGWTAIGCTTGAVGCALIAAAVLWLAVVAVSLFVVVASN
ncbi:hypothetical protein [Streptomyces sp. NPDC052302]|uniref:hypothetical protein n=1 Tax=unclassified Streptomyces TaxID=2593676 RepID=UPI0037D8A415